MASKLKTFVVHCTGGKNQALEVDIEAINPPQAVEFAKARFPGYTRYYSSRQKN